MRRSARVRAVLGVAVALVLAASLAPAQAFAYFNRGSVGVGLGAASVEVQAGGSVGVSVSLTPASDEQTEGCGMPKCPQGCSASCTDENGQCRCAGTEYSTYYPTATASSSDASVAVAVYSNNTLTVYGKQEGEATITVRGSLRQFTDGEATLHVTVSGSTDGSSGTSATVEVPETAEASSAEQEDKADVVEKTVMGRPVYAVRINDACDPAAQLASLAGVDGDVTFWEGDTYYHPNYSVTFCGTDYDASAVSDIEVGLNVSTEAEGELYQLLAGMDGFVTVGFAQEGSFFAPATVYVLAESVFSDDAALSLFSYDSQNKRFVRESQAVEMSGGYAVFTVQEGKTYVVSSRDLTTEANEAVAQAGSGSQADGSRDAATEASDDGAVAPIVWVAGGIVVAALAVAAAVVVVLRRGRNERNTR